MKIKVVLKKNNCLAAIGERPMEITVDKWNAIEGNVISDLHLALVDGVLSSVAEKKIAKEIWDTLTKLYEAKSLHNKIFLERKLYTLRMTKSTTENERVELLLQSLPYSYDQLIINLTNNNPMDSLSFDDVVASVLNEESKQKNKEDKLASSQQAEALSVTRGRSTEHAANGSHNHGRSKSRKGRKGLSDVWLIDSGATWHMTSRKEWFHTYEPISRGYVYLGDDHALEIASIDTIKIKMFDGTIGTIGEHISKFSRSIAKSKCILDLFHSNVWESPDIFMGEAVKTACYIVNRSPSTAIELKTTMEMLIGKPANYFYLHAFGFHVYVMYNAQERIKLDPKSKRCIFLGYADGVKRYRLWDPTTHKIIINIDVFFVKDQLQRRNEDDSTVKEKSEIMSVYVENIPEDSDSSEAAPEHKEQELVKSETPEVRREWKPSTFHEALNNSDVTLWMTAMQEEIYMLQLEGFAEKEKENLVCRLNKSLYGLKQTPRYWYKRFDSFIMSLGYNRLSSDHCVYYKRFENNDFIILLLYVDDMLVASLNKDRKNYLKKILRRFNMQDCKPISTTLPVNFKLSSNIAQVVGAVSRYMANPDGEHWIAVKRIMRYIRGNSDVALCYGGSEFTVRRYVNLDFAEDLDKRKSTTGYVFTLAGGAVSWVSKLQTVVALSTTKVEYMAAIQDCKEAIWIQRLLEELGHKQEKFFVFCDSQSALHIARNPAFHSRTKHSTISFEK
ncbi:Integrase catalytic domain-containing protein [Citrus sinensis]|nr:Integrase catalytic domain-containing protein [Citrus sinensis]